jgi:hypothetical protein
MAMTCRLVLALLSMGLLAAAACSPRTPATAPSAGRHDALAITNVAGLPAELAAERPLWEQAHFSNAPGPSATRVYRDGRIYRHRVFRSTIVDGQRVDILTPPAWRFAGRVSAAGLAEVDRRIRQHIESGTLRDGASGPAALGADQFAITYRAWLDGREYARVEVHTGETNYDLPTPMMNIDGAIYEGIIPGSVPAKQP